MEVTTIKKIGELLQETRRASNIKLTHNLHYKSVVSYVLGLSQAYIHFYITNDYKQS